MFKEQKRIVLLILSAVVIAAAFTSVAVADTPDSESVEVTDNTSVWAGSPFVLQASSDDTVTDIEESNQSITFDGSGSAFPFDESHTGAAKTYETDAEITFEYQKNGDFDPNDWGSIEDDGQIHLIQLDEQEGVAGIDVPTSIDDVDDLLNKDDVNTNATFWDVSDKAEYSASNEFSLDLDEFDDPGAYAVLITLNGSDDGVIIDEDTNEIDEIDGDITVMGLEGVAVEEDSDETELSGPTEVEPGDSLEFEVDSTLDGDIHHAVAVYDISQVEDEALTVDIGDSDLDELSADSLTVESNIEYVRGEARVEDEIIVGDRSLVSANSREGQFTIQQIFDRIANEASTDAPESDPQDDQILDASMTAVVTDGPQATITVETNESWSDSEYRVLYLASTNSSSAEFRTKTLEDSDVGETLTVERQTQRTPRRGGGGGGGVGPAPPVVDDDETADDGETDIEVPETPTIEDVRRTLDGVQPTRSSRTAIVDNAPDRPGVTVNPENSAVSEITFSSEDAAGNVDIDEWDDPPQTVVDSVRGAVAADVEAEAEDDIEANVSVPTVADIDPDTDEVRGEAATVQITVAADRVNDPDDTVIAHERGDSWELLETTVVATEDGEVILEAETESFSYFAVAEVETEDEPAPDDGIGTTGLLGLIVVLALISVAAAVAYREMNSGADEEIPQQ